MSCLLLFRPAQTALVCKNQKIMFLHKRTGSLNISMKINISNIVLTVNNSYSIDDNLRRKIFKEKDNNLKFYIFS